MADERQNESRIVSAVPGPGGGRIKRDKIIEDLQIDCAAIAVDIDWGREIRLRKGSLFEAVLGSIAIPRRSTPHCFHSRLLVDGGILNPVPVAPTLRSLNDLTVVIDGDGTRPAGRH